MHNERAMQSRFVAQIGKWDPNDDLDVILNRCVDLKMNTWSKIGRKKQKQIQQKNTLKNKETTIADAVTARILRDTTPQSTKKASSILFKPLLSSVNPSKPFAKL